MTYEQTDDPNDPCAYCVHWEEPEDMNSANFEEAVPFIRPGVPATRLYRFAHISCERAVVAYVSEKS